ncbi:hypothetical protein BDR26DRAFT_940237 [Obelidium mucronatum]|nr:hypothetical protein BDR26DRAFT_940237 [Obelidium mucronatum]
MTITPGSIQYANYSSGYVTKHALSATETPKSKINARVLSPTDSFTASGTNTTFEAEDLSNKVWVRVLDPDQVTTSKGSPIVVLGGSIQTITKKTQTGVETPVKSTIVSTISGSITGTKVSHMVGAMMTLPCGSTRYQAANVNENNLSDTDSTRVMDFYNSKVTKAENAYQAKLEEYNRRLQTFENAYCENPQVLASGDPVILTTPLKDSKRIVTSIVDTAFRNGKLDAETLLDCRREIEDKKVKSTKDVLKLVGQVADDCKLSGVEKGELEKDLRAFVDIGSSMAYPIRNEGKLYEEETKFNGPGLITPVVAAMRKNNVPNTDVSVSAKNLDGTVRVITTVAIGPKEISFAIVQPRAVQGSVLKTCMGNEANIVDTSAEKATVGTWIH